jgi:type I restriction enzyme R subunit
LEGTLSDLYDELKGLPTAHADLRELFKDIRNRHDLTAHLDRLGDEAVRTDFYARFNKFARLLKLAYCSLEWDQRTSQGQKWFYNEDLGFYASLRNAAILQFSDRPSFMQYERQLQKLLDQHVATNEIIRLTETVSITDREAFAAELEKVTGTASMAETIAHRTSKYLNERMEEDPAFYLRLSELIRQSIAEYRARRISELEYLERMKAIHDQALDHGTSESPAELRAHALAQSLHRELVSALGARLDPQQGEAACIAAALAIEGILQSRVVVDWKTKPDVAKQMVFEIGDYLLDHVQSAWLRRAAGRGPA